MFMWVNSYNLPVLHAKLREEGVLCGMEGVGVSLRTARSEQQASERGRPSGLGGKQDRSKLRSDGGRSHPDGPSLYDGVENTGIELRIALS